MLKLCVLLLAVASGVQPQLRHFRGAYTSTVVELKPVTTLVPSSCVQVAPTLPPCRNIRFLRFPKIPMPENLDREEIITNWRVEPEVETTVLGWGEYLGLYAPTVTITRTDLHVTTVEDPSIVVTYAIKGCRPLTLPSEMNKCPPELSPTVSIEEILATSTVTAAPATTAAIMPTRTRPMESPTATLVLEDTYEAGEPSDEGLVSTTPTELLPF